MSGYKSKYCTEDKIVTAPQYLAELMCEKSARQKGVDLPDRFWNNPQWNRVFRRHIAQLHRLLQRFQVEAVVRAFHDQRTSGFLSFGNKRFLPIIAEHAKKLEQVKKRELQTTEVSEGTGPPRKPVGQKSAITRLREIDEQNAN
jgi:hypothetical protein